MQKMKLKTPAGHTEIIVGEGLSKESKNPRKGTHPVGG
jgi:hypothetical protein